MTVSYCTPLDIRANVAGTDAGTGTCAQLEDAQLSAAIGQASAKVSAYTGTTWADDASGPVTVPDIVKTCTVQIATYYATLTYRKSKDLSAFDPVYLAYTDAMSTLRDIASGLIEVNPGTPGGVTDEPGHVVQTLPPIFTGEDSATRRGRNGRVEPAGAPGQGWPGHWGGW